MSFFSVEDGAVKAHATSLGEAVSNFQRHSSEFDSAMQDLLGRIEGGAKPELQNLASQWMTASGQVNQALGQLQGRVDTTGNTYAQSQDAQADDMRSQGAQMDFHSADVKI